jgi:hypothetical protein
VAERNGHADRPTTGPGADSATFRPCWLDVPRLVDQSPEPRSGQYQPFQVKRRPRTKSGHVLLGPTWPQSIITHCCHAPLCLARLGREKAGKELSLLSIELLISLSCLLPFWAMDVPGALLHAV